MRAGVITLVATFLAVWKLMNLGVFRRHRVKRCSAISRSLGRNHLARGLFQISSYSWAKPSCDAYLGLSG